MWSKFQAFIDWKGEAFWAGRFDTVASCYDTPIPIYLKGAILAFPNSAEFRTGLVHLHAGLTAYGVTAMRGHTKALGLPGEHGQIRADVRWEYLCGESKTPLEADVTYFCRPMSERFSVEMVEYRKPLPERVYGRMLSGSQQDSGTDNLAAGAEDI